MERLEFIDDNGEKTQFYVIEETRINGINYLLVSESDDENEEAEAYNNLIEIYNYTQEELAEKLGKTRSAISNKLRLLILPEKVKQMVRENQLSYGQARTLLAFKDKAQIEELSEEIIKKQYSVRELEIMAKKKQKKSGTEKEEISASGLGENSDEMEYLKSKLIEFFESKVDIKLLNENLGKLEIEFYGYEDLERILNILKLELE